MSAIYNIYKQCEYTRKLNDHKNAEMSAKVKAVPALYLSATPRRRIGGVDL
jgi:hypothetical protein